MIQGKARFMYRDNSWVVKNESALTRNLYNISWKLVRIENNTFMTLSTTSNSFCMLFCGTQVVKSSIFYSFRCSKNNIVIRAKILEQSMFKWLIVMVPVLELCHCKSIFMSL